MIVMLSVVSGGFFLSNNTSEFLSATVQTTLDGSVPLSEVFFPSVVVCNINQIRKSFFAELGFYENDTLVRIMYEDFIKGTIDSERALMNEKDESYVEDPKRSAFYEVGHTQHSILFIRIFMKGMMTPLSGGKSVLQQQQSHRKKCYIQVTHFSLRVYCIAAQVKVQRGRFSYIFT